MIDWLGVAFNALWILGLAIGLTVASYAWWSATDRAVPVGEVLGRAPCRSMVLTAFVMVGVGLQYQVCDAWWERGGLSLAVVACSYSLIQQVVRRIES